MREAKDLMKEHKPMIVVLMKPRISETKADEVCKSLGKNKWIRSEASGFNGGLWVLWDEEDANLNMEYAHSSFIHLEVKTAGGSLWSLTAVYANQNPKVRKFLWDILDLIEVKHLWVLVGDFNCTAGR